jgi:hypothetical protein
LVHDSLGDDDLAPAEVDLWTAAADGQGHVVSRLRMQDDRPVEGGDRIDHNLEWLVVHDDQLGGVDGFGDRLGDDGGDRLTGESDHVTGEQRASHQLVEHAEGRGQIGKVDVGSGDDVDHSRSVAGILYIHREDPGVGGG